MLALLPMKFDWAMFGISWLHAICYSYRFLDTGSAFIPDMQRDFICHLFYNTGSRPTGLRAQNLREKEIVVTCALHPRLIARLKTKKAPRKAGQKVSAEGSEPERRRNLIPRT